MDKANIEALIEKLRSAGSGLPPPPLPPIREGGSGGGMEPRVAKLEAQVENISTNLAKLEDVPSNIATLLERTEHLATKEELGKMGDALGARVQRHMYIVGGVLGVLALLLKFLPAL